MLTVTIARVELTLPECSLMSEQLPDVEFSYN